MWWRTKFADTNTPSAQLKHMQSELDEIEDEWHGLISRTLSGETILMSDEGFVKMKQEALDLIQSTYTLLHILGMTEREHNRMKWEMEVKNHERGYYR